MNNSDITEKKDKVAGIEFSNMMCKALEIESSEESPEEPFVTIKKDKDSIKRFNVGMIIFIPKGLEKIENEDLKNAINLKDKFIYLQYNGHNVLKKGGQEKEQKFLSTRCFTIIYSAKEQTLSKAYHITFDYEIKDENFVMPTDVISVKWLNISLGEINPKTSRGTITTSSDL